MKIISFQVITALEMLHANLPPTLARSQVSSVRKHLKNQLLTLLKSVSEQHMEKFFINMTTLLTGIQISFVPFYQCYVLIFMIEIGLILNTFGQIWVLVGMKSSNQFQILMVLCEDPKLPKRNLRPQLQMLKVLKLKR